MLPFDFLIGSNINLSAFVYKPNSLLFLIFAFFLNQFQKSFQILNVILYNNIIENGLKVN